MVEEGSGAKTGEADASRESLFREQAVRHHAGPGAAGDVLRLPPSWTRWTYWLLLLLALVGVGFLVFGRLREWAAGPALVRVEGRAELFALAAGTVEAIEVSPGDRVTAGQLLLRLDAARERADWRRVLSEFEARLAARLRDPTDEAARTALSSLRAELERAWARLEERRVRAPHDALVRDVRVATGRRVDEAQLLVTLDAPSPRFRVVALLPGASRPHLRPGMPMRVELVGQPGASQWVEVAEVGDAVLGPSEARRLLGPEVADAVQLDGPVVVVRANLPSEALTVGGRSWAYHDGMPARAEAALRSKPILYALFPALESALAGHARPSAGAP